MTGADGIVQGFRAAADAALAAESAFRADWRARLEALERTRRLAFLRMNLVADLLAAASAAADAGAARAACAARLAAGFALEPGREAHAEILARFEPVAAAVAAIAHPPDRIGDEPPPEPDPAGALAAFEAWYSERHGADFLARADLPMPETPLVDW